jgi:hypothetical protein
MWILGAPEATLRDASNEADCILTAHIKADIAIALSNNSGIVKVDCIAYTGALSIQGIALNSHRELRYALASIVEGCREVYIPNTDSGLANNRDILNKGLKGRRLTNTALMSIYLADSKGMATLGGSLGDIELYRRSTTAGTAHNAIINKHLIGSTRATYTHDSLAVKPPDGHCKGCTVLLTILTNTPLGQLGNIVRASSIASRSISSTAIGDNCSAEGLCTLIRENKALGSSPIKSKYSE